MTDEEFRTFMANLAAELTAQLKESRIEFEAKLAESNAKYEERQAKIDAQYEERQAKIDAQYEKRQAEYEERQAEYEERQAKIDAQFAKTDEQLAKTDAQLAKTDAQLAKTDAQLAKTGAQLAKTDAQLAKTDARLNKLSKLFGDANNNQGEIAEEFFFRSLEKKPQIGPLKFDTVHRNLNGSKRKIQDEFDLVLINSDTLAIVEVKTKAHLQLVDKMLEEKIPHLRHLFPQFKDYKVYAGIASLVSYDELVEKTREKGLFLLTQQGKHVELINQPLHVF